MRHSKILMAAMAAGLGGAVTLMRPSDVERDLYAYARERKFPAAETLARKAAEIAGGNFPYPSLAEAPEATRVFFTAFRAVIEALEPFHEDDDPADQTEALDQAPQVSAEAELEHWVKRVDQLRAVHDIAVSPGNADANEYMRGMANGLILAVATMDGVEPAYIEPPAKQEEKLDEQEKPDDQVDEVEKKRRIAQAETDKVIAESGGKFSEPAPKKKTK